MRIHFHGATGDVTGSAYQVGTRRASVGEKVSVKVPIHTMGGFSAHADQGEFSEI